MARNTFFRQSSTVPSLGLASNCHLCSGSRACRNWVKACVRDSTVNEKQSENILALNGAGFACLIEKSLFAPRESVASGSGESI